MFGVTRSDLRHGMLRAWMLSVICIPLAASAQYPSFELGGLARGVSDVGFLTAEDTLARDVNVESHAIYDLALREKSLPRLRSILSFDWAPIWRCSTQAHPMHK